MLKNRFKKFIAVLTAAVLAASLVACSAPQSAPDNSDTDSTVSVSQSKETTKDSTEESSSAVESKEESSSEIESEENSSSSKDVSSSESKDSNSSSKDVSSSESKDSNSSSKDASSSESKDISSASKDVSSSESKDSSSAATSSSSSKVTSSSSSKVTSSSSSKVSSSSSKDSSKEPEKTEPDEAVMIRQAMIGTTDMMAVAYLGWYDNYYNYSKYSDIQNHIADWELAENHPFISKIDEDHFVPHAGGNLFCIVPADEKATVTICDYVLDTDTFTMVRGSTLYQSDDGKPVIVMGNESDIIPNILVIVTDSDGKVMEFSPELSGFDGRLVLPDEAPTVFDFTEYAKLGYTEPGSFDTSILYNTDGWTAFVETVDDDNISMALTFTEDGHVDMCHDAFGGSGFQVYYEGVWYPAYDPTLPDSTMILEMQLKQNNSGLDVRKQIAGAVSFEYDEYSEWVYMTYQDGEPLLDTAKYNEYTLHPSMG